MAHLPCFPVLIFVFLVVVGLHVPASHANLLPPTYDGSMCSESSKCGGIEIKYPFYFANATRVAPDYTTNYSCGYTDLKIFCEEETNTAIIQLDQYYKYKVKNIDYNTRSILLTDVDEFGVGTDRCRDGLHNVTFGLDWLNYEGSSHDNLTFFLDCYSESRDDLLAGLDVYKIDCPHNPPGGGGVSFVFSSEQDEVPRDHELAEHCSRVVLVPVLSDYRNGLRNISMLPKVYGNVLSQGFQLEWYRMTTGRQCPPCEESGGRCSYSQNKAFLGCLCADEKVGTTNCSNSEGIISIASPSSKLLNRHKDYPLSFAPVSPEY